MADKWTETVGIYWVSKLSSISEWRRTLSRRSNREEKRFRGERSRFLYATASLTVVNLVNKPFLSM